MDDNTQNTQAQNVQAQPEVTTQAQPTVAEPTPAEKIQQDIVKLEAEKAHMELTAKDLFSEEILNINLKIDNAKKELESLTAKVETEVKTDVEKAGAEIKQKEQSFWVKHGNAIKNDAVIILLAAIAGRLFGII